jgi:hypothetical protein
MGRTSVPTRGRCGSRAQAAIDRGFVHIASLALTGIALAWRHSVKESLPHHCTNERGRNKAPRRYEALHTSKVRACCSFGSEAAVFDLSGGAASTKRPA